MKMLILSLVSFFGLAVLAETTQKPSSPDAVRRPTLNLPRGITYSENAFPWETRSTVRLNRLLSDLRYDMELVEPTLAAWRENRNAVNPSPNLGMESSLVYPTENSTVLAKDLSTLLSQNCSANLSQNLSTSLAVPTSLPWSTWGNGPRVVLANVGGAMVAVPTFPARTAWGDKPGVVVTTPDGAVFSVVPGAAPPSSARPSPDLVRQLSDVQNDLNRLLGYLETVNGKEVAPSAAPAPSTPSGTPRVYLNPTGR